MELGEIVFFFVHSAEYRDVHDASHQLHLPSPRCSASVIHCVSIQDVLHLPHLLSFSPFFRVFVHVMFDMVVVELDVLFVFVCSGENGTSPRCHPSFSFAVTTLSLLKFSFARSFRLLLLSLQAFFTNCSCCCLRFPSFACAFLASLSACAAALFVVGGSFQYFFNDLFVFVRAQASRLQ